MNGFFVDCWWIFLWILMVHEKVPVGLWRVGLVGVVMLRGMHNLQLTTPRVAHNIHKTQDKEG